MQCVLLSGPGDQVSLRFSRSRTLTKCFLQSRLKLVYYNTTVNLTLDRERPTYSIYLPLAESLAFTTVSSKANANLIKEPPSLKRKSKSTLGIQLLGLPPRSGIPAQQLLWFQAKISSRIKRTYWQRFRMRWRIRYELRLKLTTLSSDTRTIYYQPKNY